MPDTISYAKEVYYAFRDEETGTKQLVPVRGVYVTGEYKPPEYVEPILRVLEFKTNHPLIEDYIESSSTTKSGSSHHLYDIDLDATFRIDAYTQATAPPQKEGSSHHLYDIDLDATFVIEAYQSTNVPPQKEGSSHHLYDISVDPTYVISAKTKVIGGSQPEPILRMIEFNVSSATIEDV